MTLGRFDGAWDFVAEVEGDCSVAPDREPYEIAALGGTPAAFRPAAGTCIKKVPANTPFSALSDTG